MSDDPEVTPIEPAELVEELRRLRARIPKFQQLTIRQTRSMTRVAHLNSEFVEAALITGGADPRMPSVIGAPVEDFWQQRDDAQRWSAVEDELMSMLRGVSAANLKRRHAVGTAVLQIYAVVRQLVRKKEFQHLLPHLAEMKRVNHIRGKGRKAAGKTK
ncbi:MAG TPA: hypothetical protein VGQ65_18040 [Thermoanaerobaculia bacterium]|jgi:hypothetical protein|nr:hypothetical protein [Thermoanaerobaculia bacterium]